MMLFFVFLLVGLSFFFIFVASPLYLAFLLIIFAFFGAFLILSCLPSIPLLIMLMLIIYVGAIMVMFGYVCSVSSNFAFPVNYFDNIVVYVLVYFLVSGLIINTLNFISFSLDYSNAIVNVSPGDYFFHSGFVSLFLFIAVLMLVLMIIASNTFTSFSTLRGVK